MRRQLGRLMWMVGVWLERASYRVGTGQPYGHFYYRHFYWDEVEGQEQEWIGPKA